MMSSNRWIMVAATVLAAVLIVLLGRVSEVMPARA